MKENMERTNTLDQIAQLRKEKEMQYQEAPASFNIKFVLDGYECQFTTRGEDAYQTLEKGLKVLLYLAEIKAEPRFTARLALPDRGAAEDKGNGKGSQATAPALLGVKVVLCSTCGVEAKLVTAVSQGNGRAYHAHKCPQCKEFVKGTFRWDS